VGDVSPLEKFASEILALLAEQPDLTLVEMVAALRKRRIRTSRSLLWRFLDRHSITVKKKACKPPSGSAPMSPSRADVGCGSKACLIPPGWCSSTKTAVSTNLVRLWTHYGVQLLDQYREQYGPADRDHTDDTTDNPSL
jgi:hypothetical protein